MRRYWANLQYVLRHKYYVFLEGQKLGVPLLWLLLHDWDKFLPDEFIPYARQFYWSDGRKRKAPSDYAADVAWLKHQRRNKHHWQRWLLLDDAPIRETNYLILDTGAICYHDDMRMLMGATVRTVQPLPMPDRHRREMLADWRGVSRHFGTELRDWYFDPVRQLVFKRFLHPDTLRWLDEQIDPNWAELREIAEKHGHE